MKEQEIKEKFAYRLNELRASAHVSARKMSIALGQNPGYINNIEKQRTLPTLKSFFQICDYLGVTPSYFLESFDEEKEKVDKEELIEMLSSLDNRSLDALYVIIKDMIG